MNDTSEFHSKNALKSVSEICASQDTKQIQNAKRRDFVKNSGKFAFASVALGAMASVSPLLANSGKTAQNSNKGKQMTQNSNPQVWYITGASGGLGFALAKYLLEKGDKVAVTSRKKANLEKKFGELAKSENFLALTLTFDNNIDKQAAQNIKAVEQKFGRIDNVVNNAGYGLLGFVEEVSEKQLREQFEVNIFAPFLVAQNALKIMRPQAISEGGSATNIKARIYNISSIGGFKVSQCASAYCMTKFALSALSEGLNLDLKDFGIATINVMPGGFRTEFFGTSKNFGDLRVKDYDESRESFKAIINSYNGKQSGNPEKFAEVLYQTSRLEQPPQHLFMSDGAFRLAREKIAAVEANMKATESYAGSAVDFPS